MAADLRRFRCALKADADAIVAVTNEAFQADAYFKLPEFHNRFSLTQVEKMMSAEQGVFLVAEASSGDLLGSIYLTWEIESSGPTVTFVGHFSAVSVRLACEKRGIGRGLVAAAESFLLDLAQSKSMSMSKESSVAMEMGVINLRADLFPFYEKQGYVQGERLPHSEELSRIILPERIDEVFCMAMRKNLSPSS